MADEKKAPVAKEAAPKKAEAKASKKVEAKEEAKKVITFAKPIAHDYEVVRNPIITEKSMALLQNQNKVTIEVADDANKLEIKESFQRLYSVPVANVSILNQRAKEKSRGGRYKGAVSGYKKAIVTIAKGSAIDLFKE
jgi:large subunit ribosomal protein L23